MGPSVKIAIAHAPNIDYMRNGAHSMDRMTIGPQNTTLGSVVCSAACVPVSLLKAPKPYRCPKETLQGRFEEDQSGSEAGFNFLLRTGNNVDLPDGRASRSGIASHSF